MWANEGDRWFQIVIPRYFFPQISCSPTITIDWTGCGIWHDGLQTNTNQLAMVYTISSVKKYQIEIATNVWQMGDNDHSAQGLYTQQ